jgi:hypothetical protein
LHSVESASLFALHEAYETILTAVETIDPATETMLDRPLR